MSVLPVNAIYSGMQSNGYWAGTPALIIQLMEHPAAATPLDSLDESYPLADWPIDPVNEVSLNKLLARRPGACSPHFARVGASTLAVLAASYREPHIMFLGRDPGRHDLAPLVTQLVKSGRSVQIEATSLSAALAIPDVWITLVTLPSRGFVSIDVPSAEAVVPNEVLACIRWKSDLDRAERVYARGAIPVWLRPSPSAEDGIYRQCVAVATHHVGWRVIPYDRQSVMAS